MTLQAAADAYGTRICLVTSYEDRGILRVEPAEPVAGEEPRTAWLAFWAEIHYSSIVPMGEAVAEAPGSIVVVVILSCSRRVDGCY